MPSLEDILAGRVGPQPADVLRDIVSKYPNMSAVVVVVQTTDGDVMAYAGGCTAIESIGLLSLAASTAAASQIRGGG